MHLRRLLLVAVIVASCGCTRTETLQAALPEPVLGPESPPPAVQVEAPASQPLTGGCARTTVACVSTRTREAWLQRDGHVVYGPVPVSLGGPGHRTPTGTFRVAWKDDEHWSSTYGIPMPWSVFFAYGGIAFHEGPLDESSHGCVHLAPAAARRFFAELDRGDRVQVL